MTLASGATEHRHAVCPRGRRRARGTPGATGHAQRRQPLVISRRTGDTPLSGARPVLVSCDPGTVVARMSWWFLYSASAAGLR